MKHILTIAIAAIALGGCVQPTPIAASPEVVAKCGPPPTRAWGAETSAQHQQRLAVYMLCGRGDPSYPSVLAATIQAEARQRQYDAAQSQADFWAMQNAQAQQQSAFWNMVGAMNSLPH